MEMDVDKLKGVRAQKHLWCVLLFCAIGMEFAYILCATRAQMNEVCVLAFLYASCQRNGIRPLFRPCRPRVAILGARRDRNRSPPGQARVGPHRGDSESAKGCRRYSSFLQMP